MTKQYMSGMPQREKTSLSTEAILVSCALWAGRQMDSASSLEGRMRPLRYGMLALELLSASIVVTLLPSLMHSGLLMELASSPEALIQQHEYGKRRNL